jgi:amino acid adenylation domain-containing protein
MASSDFESQLKLYWQKALVDFNASIFPTPRQLPRKQSPDSIVSRETTITFSKNTSIEVPVLIRAAWALAIGSVINSNDVVFGVTVDSENVDDQGSLLAPFRVKWTRDDTIADYLDTIHQQKVDMASYERVGISKIAAISPQGSEACNFESVLDIHARQQETSQIAYSTIDDRALVLRVLHDQESVSLKVDFDSTFIDLWEIDQILGIFTSLVQQLGQCYATDHLADLRLVADAELEKIWNWNATVPTPLDQCVHTMIEQHAYEQPNAVAVHAWDGQLTYGELNRLSTLLACYLEELGIRPGSLVPLCFEKSMWAMVALLGILKAGSGFVLLDPSLPEERLRTVARQTGGLFMLSSTSNEGISSRLVDKVIVINSSFFSKLNGPRPLRVKPTPESVMYVVFTSGSSGIPKGAMISHRNFASAMKYQLELYQVSTRIRMFDFSSYSFVASIANIFIAFTSGGCVCIPSEHDKRNRLAESIASLNVNVLHLTPSIATLITPEQVPAVELVVFSGEGLHIEDLKGWWGKARVLNVLGLSECAPRSVLNASPRTPEEATRIGKGVGQVTWVVDPKDYNRLMPVGCIGELLLEGPLVGLGYLNDARRTSESFVHDPLWLLEGFTPKYGGRRGRVYMTGDLVRYNQDGSLSYIGRKDAQVKIRGQRIETSEVEHWMKKALGAESKQVVVDVVKPGGDSARSILVAFIQFPGIRSASDAISFQDTKVSKLSASTKQLLAQYLPEYMLPTVQFSMAELPTTATGKLDRRALRKFGDAFSLEDLATVGTEAGPKRSPNTKQEQHMQVLWSQIIQIEPSVIGLDDTFVALGGDSIGAMKLVSEGRKIGLNLSVAYILGSSTLQEVAAEAHKTSHEGPIHIPAFDLLPADTNVPMVLGEVSRLYEIEKQAIADMYPCTPLGEGLFSLSLKHGDYISQRVLRLAFDVDIHLFCKAWETVAAEMEVLRTRIIPHTDGRLYQLIVNESISFITTASLEEYLENDRNRPMQLGRPLVRYALIEDGLGNYSHFVLTIHHALYDGWSMGLITAAVEKVYRGHLLESQPKFNAFIQYISRQDIQVTKSYWNTYLDGYDGALYPANAPGKHQSSIDTRFKHEISNMRITSARITLSSLIRAAWAMVVGLELDAQDIVFGVPVSGRSAPLRDIERLPAPTLATIPIRVQWANSEKVVDFLDSVHKRAIDTIPFEQAGLSAISKTGEGSRRACGFQNLLLIQPEGRPTERTLGEWELKDYQELNTYALTIEVKLSREKITVYAGFDSRTVEAHTVQRMIHRLESVMQQLSRADQCDLLSEIDVVTKEEIEDIWRWNCIVPEAVNCLVHEMIETQASAVPTSPAITAWDAEISYGNLDHLSNVLAWRLVDMGLRSGEIIPLCFEKSAWTVVSLLAVMKAGGVFVLLDHALPEKRLKAIVRQTKARVIISSTNCQSLSSRLVQNVITVSSTLAFDMNSQQKRNFPCSTPDSILYVAFTSGSTGEPKGAQISHSNLASSIHHQMEHYAYYKEARVFDFSSYSFDMSIFAILHTLAVGACLCIPNDDQRKSNLALSINTLRADTLVLTPSVMRTLEPGDIPQVTSILWIGEALLASDIAPWSNPAIRKINAYGPAECTPVSTMNVFNTISSLEKSPHIGRGVGHVTWIVDPKDSSRLAAVGSIGELLLEGPLVGQGYLDARNTASAFIEDPPWLLQGSMNCRGRRGRLYKTGDLVRYNKDGTLDFVGRKDDQVKIRGQRVELGEVEYHLKQSLKNAEVAAVVVSASEMSSHPSLVAFVTRHNPDVGVLVEPRVAEGPDLEADVKTILEEHLPSSMIPSAIFCLPGLPMTPTGKTDRKRLREIGSELLVKRQSEVRKKAQKDERHALTRAEEQLRQIWSQVLEIPESDIGLEESFFELGGDSITAMKASSIARASAINIGSTDIFLGKPISKLAASLECV